MGMAAAWVATVGVACAPDEHAGAADAGSPDVGRDAGDTDAVAAADAGADGDAGAALDAGPGTAATGGFVAPTTSSTAPSATSLPPASPFRALQMNLCNSGVAGCYEDGQAVGEAYGVITQFTPDVVTLNEICEDDVASELLPAMIQAWPDDFVFWVFAPAARHSTGGPVNCTDGQRFGVGILGHVAAASWAGFEFAGDRLTVQSSDDEMRAWACANAADNYDVCATHLENDDGDVALLQCQEVMNPIVPQFWGGHGGALPTTVGGDLNLSFRGNPDVQDCVPPGWFRKGDGDVQHIMATDDFTFESSELISMEHTDHDAWLVRLVTP